MVDEPVADTKKYILVLNNIVKIVHFISNLNGDDSNIF